MAHRDDLIETDILGYLKTQEEKDLLRFITCGSVDDGKSTLIGRLLYDSKLIFEDQLAAVSADSKKAGTRDGETDLALLVDGLQAEREQGITIDVAYRFFSTGKRKFIVADTPGHEQYTRNTATGASSADLAVILIDSRKGVLPQTRRHSYIVNLLGIRHLIVAVNKMDLVGFDQSVFDEIVAEYQGFADRLAFAGIHAIPVSALTGDNVFSRSTAMPWHDGPALLELLESIDVRTDSTSGPFRMPVQWVNRPNPDFRGFSGMIASGTVAVGDAIMVSPSGKTSSVKAISTFDGDLSSAAAGQSVTLLLNDEIDISRGDLIADAEMPPQQTDQFAAHVLWMHEEDLLPERQYIMKVGSKSVLAAVTELKYEVNINSLEHMATKTLRLNGVACANFSLDHPVGFDPYEDVRETGAFILIDRFTNATVGCGMIDFGLRRATNLTWHQMDVSKESRARQKNQKACVLWFTGLSGSGKSTIANAIEKHLQAMGRHTYMLDGDNIRHGLNKDLGFTDADRVENIRRVAEVSALFVDAGIIVLSSFISPFRDERRMAREMLGDDEFFEVFVDTPLDVCEQRDPKGLYRKARAGKIKNFTGIDSDYERPENPEIVLQSADFGVEDLADQVITALRDQGYI